MGKGYKLAGAFLIAVIIGSILSNRLGWYGEYWFADVILHTLSGVMFGFFWLGMTDRERFGSQYLLLVSAVAFGVFGSFLWEMWELWGSTLVPQFPTTYVPELKDSLWDMTCGAIGAAGAWLTFYTFGSGSRKA